MSESEGPGGGSRPSKGTNSVNDSASESERSDVPAIVGERVAEFRERYPDLAGLPLSRNHGRSLRRAVTSAEWTEEVVDTDVFGESGFTTRSLDRRGADSWADAIAAFLTAHLRYDGLMARFSDGADEFEIPLTDAWTQEYQRKQYARAQALDRVMAGGTRPSGGEVAPAWESPATAMLTLSGSSVPDGDRVSPVDHLDKLHDAWSYDGVRDTLRNVMEYHLDLDSSEWGCWLQAEPHGVGGNGGLNACYTHIHVAVYYDGAGLGAARVGDRLEKVIDKHLDVCDLAGPNAHDYESIDDYAEESDGCISINEDVADLGCYMAAYNGGSFDERLEERPIEYVAWGALYWATSRQRTTRSQTLTHAISSDRCWQRYESEESNQEKEHGEDVEWRHANGPDVVCSCCSSGWRIDQDQLDGPEQVELPDTEPVTDGGELSLRERWPSSSWAVSVGEPQSHAEVRQQVRRWRAANPNRDPSTTRLVGELGIHPRHADLVDRFLSGDWSRASTDSFARPAADAGWELVAIVEDDGTEHSPGGGGVDMAELHLPVEHLLSETRLRHDLRSGEKFRCGKCDFATGEGNVMARHLVNHGFTRVDFVESILEVEDYYNNNRSCMSVPQR